uniref:Cytochrome b5 heme-binding domain-containing protein n=1 Tax=Craspedostauros australis TaxID=1486917 RepID=A0A6T6I1N8_9STRA|mmetsp:Transcript_860/g.2440  ORF Transcript_860/g.2440 Transcript_860/m.2440 type:complete len:293 (+) Transcript_860:310-1188(+)|eukprot:CAMPEP_0198108294 /NCGR_PEP_ID=MMETSP1442-20131203/328_1 /TAXON_ID= /ORGANISM="Craspedostauros australis, Strain CCMP3328" /LENGTH=292 /DNA_ID=CAMNT_0043763523 /DNA_START=253 /DNA_END=1131 /DNA_ORIENTATION=-
MVLETVKELIAAFDDATGVPGCFGYIVIAWLVVLGHYIVNSGSSTSKNEPNDSTVEKEEEEEPQRNFTFAQLKEFDGTNDEKTGEPKPVYLSLDGAVFDVSGGRNFYGPGGPYENFAGHECGVALAKMSLDTEHLDDLEGCSKLNFGEKTELESWVQKFTYFRGYPVKGRLVPDTVLDKLKDRKLTKADIASFNGRGDEVPEGYGTAPIYLGASGKVYDVSFGGMTFYGKDGGYNRFAGLDASRALAKMSFDPEDAASSNVDDLDDKEKKVLADWIKTFEQRKKYPIVGVLE